MADSSIPQKLTDPRETRRTGADSYEIVSDGRERHSNDSRRTSNSSKSSRSQPSISAPTKTYDGLHSPQSSSSRLIRERHINEMEEKNDNLPESGHARHDSGGSTDSIASHICLCQPDPKIPRPRNGKKDRQILYYLS